MVVLPSGEGDLVGWMQWYEWVRNCRELNGLSDGLLVIRGALCLFLDIHLYPIFLVIDVLIYSRRSTCSIITEAPGGFIKAQHGSLGNVLALFAKHAVHHETALR